MQKPIALTVDDVSKSFKLPHEKSSTLKSLMINPFNKRTASEQQHVLKNISFKVEQGEFLGIVGRNGGGKSTLLKVLASIYTPEKGSVQVVGKLVPFIELGVGFNPELTGKDNVYLNGALLGFSDKEIDAIYDDIVAFAELERFMDQKLKNYSSGMQVRLAFSLATRSKADILLVDEVLAVGDIAFQRKCYDYFSSLRQEKKTVIFISHDMNAVREYCTRALLVDAGRIVASGSADEIAEQYVQIFSGKTKTPDESGNIRASGRWGNGSAHIDVKLLKQSATFIRLRTHITANKDITDQIVGISIHASDATVLFGTNTELLRKKIPVMHSNDRIVLEWEIPNIFRDGSYSISIASHGYGGLPVYDWWDSALTFHINSGRHSPYPVTPPILLNIVAE